MKCFVSSMNRATARSFPLEKFSVLLGCVCGASVLTGQEYFEVIHVAEAQVSDDLSKIPHQEKAILKIEITGYKETSGLLRVSLFETEKGFPSQADLAVRSITVQPENGKTIVQFEGLSPNRKYAAAVLEDKNKNGKLDTNFLGIPKEGIAVTGGPNLWLGAPRFQDCAFLLTQVSTTLELKLYYF